MIQLESTCEQRPSTFSLRIPVQTPAEQDITLRPPSILFFHPPPRKNTFVPLTAPPYPLIQAHPRSIPQDPHRLMATHIPISTRIIHNAPAEPGLDARGPLNAFRSHPHPPRHALGDRDLPPRHVAELRPNSETQCAQRNRLAVGDEECLACGGLRA